jgi:hypothetical protein
MIIVLPTRSRDRYWIDESKLLSHLIDLIDCGDDHVQSENHSSTDRSSHKLLLDLAMFRLNKA